MCTYVRLSELHVSNEVCPGRAKIDPKRRIQRRMNKQGHGAGVCLTKRPIRRTYVQIRSNVYVYYSVVDFSTGDH